MHSQGVFIQVEHSDFGSTRGSGVQINNLIITHGSILASLCFPKNDTDDMFERYNSIIKELQAIEKNIDVGSKLIKFKVLHKKSMFVDGHEQYLAFKSCSGEDLTLEEVKFHMLHTYTGMPGISTEISNWTSFNDINDDSGVYHLSRLLLPKFIVLSVGMLSTDLYSDSCHAMFNTLRGTILYPGMPLVIESTPFNNYSLFNSWSRGIVSKIIGPLNDGIITDARLVTGCEGGPIFTFEKGDKGKLIGIVIQTISWCSGEWVGFSLGLSIKHLLKEVLGLQTTIDYIPFNKLLENIPTSEINIDTLGASIVFVRCRHKWGSGVVINENEGLILTCSHIIQHDCNSVFVLCENGQFRASVLYASPISTPYDLALLSVGKVPKLKELKMADTPPVFGESVIAAGYPLSTEPLVTHNRTPMLSMGCVAKVSRRGGPLQTTCCTQSGLSGGALLRPPDQLLGMIVSNIRLDSTTMPSFSFALSVEDIKGPITKYIATKDPSYLQSLCKESSAVKMEWSLTDCKL